MSYSMPRRCQRIFWNPPKWFPCEFPPQRKSKHGAHNPPMKVDPLGLGQVAKDRHHAHPALLAEVVVAQVSDDSGHRHPSFFGQRLCFGQPNRRQVHRGHRITLLSEVDTIASLPVGETEHLPRRNGLADRAQKVIGRGAIGPARFAIAFIPH